MKKFIIAVVVALSISGNASAEDTIVSIGKKDKGCETKLNQTTRERVFKECVAAAFKEGMKQGTKYNDASEVVDSCSRSAYHIAFVDVCETSEVK